MIGRNIFIYYCDRIRERLSIKGIIIYNAFATRKLSVAGWPFSRINAVNDNEAAK